MVERPNTNPALPLPTLAVKPGVSEPLRSAAENILFSNAITSRAPDTRGKWGTAARILLQAGNR